MSKSYKTLIILILVVFILPIAASFCCCKGCANVHYTHASSACSSHKECNHAQIISDAIKQDLSLFRLNSFAYRWGVQGSPLLSALPIFKKPSLSTGPLDKMIASLPPVYLQISVLRI